MKLSGHATAWSCATLLVVISLSQTLCKTPLLRIIELNICRSYYQNHNRNLINPDGFVQEKWCKIIPVQQELATVNGFYNFFATLIELLTAFPYASLAERLDRRTILLANVAGGFTAFFYTMCICYFYQSFSIKMIWLQHVFRIFGGGEDVLLSLSNAMIAETVPLANLSKIIFILNSSRLFVNAASQTAGAYLMHENLWLPMLVGLSLHGLTIPVLFLITDPRHHRRKSSSPPITTTTTTTRAIARVTDPLLAITTQSSHPKQQHLRSLITSASHSFRNALNIALFLIRDPITAPILGILFWNELGHGVNNIVQQWASKMFHWSLASTNYLLSSQRVVAGLNLILLFIIVHRMQQAGVGSRQIDLRIVWFSQGASLLGMFGAAISGLGNGNGSVQFACALLVYMLGWGMAGALQSIVTGVSDRDHVTQIYVGLNVAARAASVVSGPVFAGLLAGGLRAGGQWVFLPFYVTVVIFLGVGALTVRLTWLLAQL